MSAIPRERRNASPIRELALPAVWIDGSEVTADAIRTLGPLRIRQEVSAPAVCELELDLTSALNQPRHAMALRVRMEGSADDAFTGEIVAITHVLGPDGIYRVRIRAFDRSHRLRQTSGVIAHTDMTVAAVAETLVAPHGFGVSADASGPLWPRVIQSGESDLEFLSRLAADAGLWWQLEGDTLRLRAWEPGDEHEVAWGYDLLEAAVDSDATAAATSVRTIGWDPVGRQIWDTAATSSRAGERTYTGDALLGGAGEVVMAGGIYPTANHAEALAQSELDYRSGGAATIRAVVRGDLRWRPGAGITLADQADEIAGPYLITAVEHLVDGFSGYVCVVSSRPIAGPVRRSPGTTGFTIAKVLDIDDPDHAGRVRVSFPALDGIESEWLPVLSLGAGEDKGLFCQPDIDDTVLVLQSGDDLGRGVVLGGLFADKLPGDNAGVVDRAVRRFGWHTSDGQRLLLNRDGDSVVISNSAGSRIELNEDGVLLHAEADLIIEAPGKKMIIRADTVDFERR